MDLVVVNLAALDGARGGIVGLDVVVVDQPVAGADGTAQELMGDAVVARKVAPRRGVVDRSVSHATSRTPILEVVTADTASVNIVMAGAAEPQQVPPDVVAALGAEHDMVRVGSLPPLAHLAGQAQVLEPVAAEEVGVLDPLRRARVRR